MNIPAQNGVAVHRLGNNTDSANEEPVNENYNRPNQMSVILVAAGSSTRMEGVDKLALDVGGRSIIQHSLDVFGKSDLVECVVVVAHETRVDELRREIDAIGYSKPFSVVSGGIRRQDSVCKGLDELRRVSSEAQFIAVHDAARPFIGKGILERGLATALHIGAAVPVTPLKDTIKRVENGIVTDTPDRALMFSVQTPQVFRKEILSAAHETVSEDVTDDAAMIEVAGGLVATFEGDHRNIKITTRSDIPIARAIASPGDTAGLQRYGIGFDGHRLVEGGPLKLGGVEIDFGMHLQGHSDGDVLMHAVASAILGASGLGDLGSNFPSSDPRYAGADSTLFVREAAQNAASVGWHFEHLDATVIAEIPRLMKYVPQFESNIAHALGKDEDRVNVKVTSTDGVGAIGAGEGIAAQAIMTLRC